MPAANFSGKELVKALRSNNFRPIARKGSHVKLRYEHPKTGEIRIVTVPMTSADDISQDTYRSIANQCGASDFERWIEGIDSNC